MYLSFTGLCVLDGPMKDSLEAEAFNKSVYYSILSFSDRPACTRWSHDGQPGGRSFQQKSADQ